MVEVSDELLLVVKIFYSIVAISGTFGNILLITSIATNKKLRTVTNVFLINGAISDLIVCCFFLPVSVPLLNGPPNNKAFCTLLGYINVGCTGVLSFSFFLIALSLYVPACKSLDLSRRIFTRRNNFLMCLATWVIIGVSYLPLFFGIGSWGYSSKFGVCLVSDDQETFWAVFGFVQVSFLYPTMALTLFLYFKLYKRYKKSIGQIANWDKEYHNASGSDLDEGEEKEKVISKKIDQNLRKHDSVTSRDATDFRENEKRTFETLESENIYDDYNWDSGDEGSVRTRDTKDSGTVEDAVKPDIEANQENTELQKTVDQQNPPKSRRKKKSSIVALKRTRKHTNVSTHIDIDQLDRQDMDTTANSNAPEEEVEEKSRKPSQWMSSKGKDADKVKRQGSWVKTHFLLWVNFLIFWTPMILVYTLDYYRAVPSNVYHVIYGLTQSCCALSYLILPVLNVKFRVAYKKLLTCDF